MTSLADEFLADIASDEEDEAVSASNADDHSSGLGTGSREADRDAKNGGEESALEAAAGDPVAELEAIVARVRADVQHEGPVKTLLDYIDSVKKNQTTVGERDVRRVAAANDVVGELTRHVDLLHRRVKEAYAPRFPELESLVPGAVEYARAVRMIGNEMDVSALPLAEILPHSKVVGIAISANTTNGRQLPEGTLRVVQDACDVIVDLEQRRQQVSEFIEARMRFIAPNVTAIVGSELAAKLMITAGGLKELSVMPAGTVQLLGQGKITSLVGFSSRSFLPHTGFIYYSDLVQSLPPETRMKGCRVVAGKVTLAARADAAASALGGGGDDDSMDFGAVDDSLGRQYREYCETHMEKELAPPPVKVDKPLPAPDSKPKTRRGGKRLRKMKERFEMTELRRQQNRLAFNEPEATYRDTGFGFGMIGVNGSGKIRVAAVDKGILKKVKQDAARVFASTPGMRTSLSASRSIGTVSGLTSVAFTPSQGIELGNPSAVEPPKPSSLSAAIARAQSSPDGYFSSINPFAAHRK